MSSFNQRQPKAGPSVLPPPHFQQDNSHPKPTAYTKRSYSGTKVDTFLNRKIATNSRIEKDEKYKKDMHLAYVNNALLQKTKGNNTPFDELVQLFSSSQSPNSQVVTTTIQLRLSLAALSHVVSQLERTHFALVEAIVNLPWATMDALFSKSYISFIGMLVSARPQYLSLVLERIAIGFTSRAVARAADSFASEEPMPPVTRRMVYDRFHNLLEYLFSLIPTLPSSLYPLLVRNFPHKRQERVDQETYIRNLLRITEYCPALTDRIIGIIIDRMIQIDVEIQVEIEELENKLDNEEIFAFDSFDTVIGQEGNISDDDESDDVDVLSDLSSEAPSDNEKNVEVKQDSFHIKDMVMKLDSMMELLFEYFQRVNKLYDTDATSLSSDAADNPRPAHETKKSLFIILLSIFDRTIIRTFRSRYTQFLIFWYSSLDPEFTDMFQGMLVSKALLEEDQPIVTRAAAASYVASFVSRALFIDATNARMVIGLMCDYLEHHLDECAALGKDFDPNATYHSVFYTVAQSVFYMFCFRWRDFQIEETEFGESIAPPKKWISKLDVMERAIKSDLNPLKFCSPEVVKQFACVAHATDFLYCYTIISNNKRSGARTSDVTSSQNNQNHFVYSELNAFFPFDPYKLPLSSLYIQDIYREWSSVAIEDAEDDDGENESDDEEVEGIPVARDSDITGGLSNSFGGMSISPVHPLLSPFRLKRE